jgi:signal transduction histidine kinase
MGESGEGAVDDPAFGEVATLVTDGAGLILEANEAASGALNLSLPYLMRKPLTVFVHPPEYRGFFTRLAQIRNTPGLHTWELRIWPYRRPSYDARMHVDSRSVTAADGLLRWWWRAYGEPPDHQRTEAVLETGSSQESSPADELETLRRTYVAAVSHDLLTPLTIIKGHAEVLDDPAVRQDPELAGLALRAIRDEIERLQRQITNVLDTARVSSGVLTVERSPLQLRPLIEGACQRFGGRSRRHQFVADLPESLPLVLGDRDRLESVLYNLLENAVKYAPQGGEVRVRAIVHSRTLEVSVEDRGAGIPLAEREHVFQPYYRLGSPTGSQIRGSGLGLYICKAVVEAHGGRIWIECDGASGTVVRFTVPRAPDGEPGSSNLSGENFGR